MPTRLYTSDVNNPQHVEKKTAQADELLDTVKNFRGWIMENLEKKDPDYANEALRYLDRLEHIAKHEPADSYAALMGIGAVWNMFISDAHIGFGVRHGRKDLPTVAPENEVVRLWAELYETNPDIKKSHAVKKIAEKLECSERTVWNRLQQVGI